MSLNCSCREWFKRGDGRKLADLKRNNDEIERRFRAAFRLIRVLPLGGCIVTPAGINCLLRESAWPFRRQLHP